MKTALTWMMLVTQCFAAKVAIIDSGVDFKHTYLKPRMWINPVDRDFNQVDEDHNGLVDDVFGWNFAGNNHKVIDYKYLNLFPESVYKFFGIQSKMMDGTATSEEVDWMNEKRNEKRFLLLLSTFGNFIHGSHVAGISSQFPRNKVMAIKLLPTSIIDSANKAKGETAKEESRGMSIPAGMREKILFMALKRVAGQQGTTLGSIGKYVASKKMDVANGSFGTGMNQAKMIVGTLFKVIWMRTAQAEELERYSKFFLAQSLLSAKKMTDAASQTLFVFAAGNDGTNNDKFPTSPASIISENVISVAATHGRKKLARFSNFGKRLVHVAAPGVNIKSTIPGNRYMKFSGTSQAAPYVSNVAGMIKEINPALGPRQIKKILMGTVDMKDYLKGKVLSSGIVNPNRAAVAAKLTKEFTIGESMSKARASVADIEVKESFFDNLVEAQPIELPSMYSL
jgi:cell wall-associated protease